MTFERRLLVAICTAAILLGASTPSGSGVTVHNTTSRNASDARLHRVSGVMWDGESRFTGEIVTTSRTGKLQAKDEYINGLRDGASLAWFQDGMLAYRRQWKAGREDGLHTGWWEDGSLHFIYHFANGVLEGEAREWYPNGQIYRDFNYEHGQESGSEVMWYTNGSVRANYVMRDGRRFGLPGVKGCMSPDSDKVKQ